MSRSFAMEMIRQDYLEDLRPFWGRYWQLWGKAEDGSLTGEERAEFEELARRYDEATSVFIGRILQA